MRLQSTALQIQQYGNDGEYYIHKYLQSFMNEGTAKVYGKSIYEFFNWKVGDKNITIMDLIVNPDEAGDYNLTLIKLLQSGKIKTNTYNSRIKGIKNFYNWLISETYDNIKQRGLIHINPFANIKQLDTEGDTEGSDFLSVEEVILMLNNPLGEDEHTKTRNRLMFLLAITTGIRNKAIVSIQPTNLQFIEGEWCITTLDKGSKPVKKAIKEEYYNELMEWYCEDLKLRGRKNKSIFNITPETATRIITKWAVNVGIVKEIVNKETGEITLNRKITFHSLRTTSAIEVYKKCGNIYEVQKFMGHKEIVTTEIYTGKDKQVIKIGKNIIDNIGNSNKFDDIVNEMDENSMRELLLSLDAQIKAQLLLQIQK